MGRALVSAPVMSSWRVPARGHTRLWQGFVAGEGPRGPGSRGHQVAHPRVPLREEETVKGRW